MRSDLDKYESAKTACQKVAYALLSATGASRITYRIATSTPGLCPVFVEALAQTPPGLVTLLTVPDIDLSKAETFTLIVKEKKILLHKNCLDSWVPSPQVLIERYGAKSQMLLPTFVNGEIFSMVSVHEAKGVRDWEKEKVGDGRGMVQVLREAGEDFGKALGVEGWIPGENETIDA